LTYNLLKLVNSSAFGFRHKIKSVKQAVVVLGEREIKKWINFVVLRDMGKKKPDELTRLSLIRARFAELLAIKTRFNKESEDMFLLGLFSLLDTILNRPIKEVLNEIQASSIIKQALIDGSGEIGMLYKMMIAYEKAEWEDVVLFAEQLKIDDQLVAMAYMEALIWYGKITEV